MCSVLDVVLDLPLHFFVVLVTLARLKINEEAELVVKAEQVVLLGVVDLKLALEAHRIRARSQVGAAAGVAVAVLWDVLLDANTVLIGNHIILVVVLSAILADDLCLFNIDKDFIWERNVNKGVKSTAILFEQLGILGMVGEVDQNGTILRRRCQSEELDSDLLTNKALLVTVADHLSNLLEEGMRKVGITARVPCGSVLQHFRYGDDRDTKVNGEPGTCASVILSKHLPRGEFVEKNVGRAEESNLGCCGPAANEIAAHVSSAKVLELLEHGLHVYNIYYKEQLK